METEKCSVCGRTIEYTSIIADQFHLDTAYENTITGLIDMVSRDIVCARCEKKYYGN